MKSIYIAVILTFFMKAVSVGQEIIPMETVENTIESIDGERNMESMYEQLADRSMRPVDLNAANEEDIGRIPFLNQAQQKSLLDYTVTYGELFSIYELQSVAGFDSALIRKIEPYIAIRPKSNIPPLNLRNFFRYGRQDLLLRYEQSFPRAAGYLVSDSLKRTQPNSFYPGGPQKYYFRYIFNWFDKIRIGIAGEKDPGEQLFNGAQSAGMDFYSGYVSISKIGFLENLTIGNFRAGFGQGLTFGSGIALNSVPGFSSNPVSTGGINPSLAMNEGSYLRGLAATFKIGHCRITSFVSYHPRDATVTKFDTVAGQPEEIGSIIETGYHRTGLEVGKKNTLTELVAGANANVTMAPSQKFGFRIGLTAVYVRYSVQISRSQDLYKIFAFTGDHNLNTGLDFQVRFGKLHWFGEISRSLNSGLAWLSGMTVVPDPRVTVTLAVRDYQPQYQNLYSNAFGQQSLNSNEQGLYASMNAAVHPKITLSGFLDYFRIPWLKYRVDGPSYGLESGVLINWLTGRNVSIAIRYLHKKYLTNGAASDDQNLHKLTNYESNGYQFGVNWTHDPRFNFKTRFDIKEVVVPDGKNDFGYLISQDFHFNADKWLSGMAIRFALFDIPTYSTRIYIYEPEVLYGYSVPAYQGKGLRCCTVLKFKILKRATFWVRGGITWYSDRTEVGSGLDLTEGNIRGEVTGQILVRW